MVPGFAAVTRAPVLALHRGLVVTDFVDRCADPVGVMAADGSFHRAEALVAAALRAMAYAAAGGRRPTVPPGVAYPAHWRAIAVEALRRELLRRPEWSARMTLIPDAAAAVTALQADPGLPTRGIVALCDFGGTGTSVTLADAADGYRPIGATVRYTDFSGDLIDRAVLTHVLADLGLRGGADAAGTTAIGTLQRLRKECRAAKERLSRVAVTTLFADVAGFRGEVRLTRAELDGEIRRPLAAVVDSLREQLFRNGIGPADLAAVATVGGGANIAAVTTSLSERLRVPVISTPRPELTAAHGAALRSVRRSDSVTAVAPAQSATLRALAWSAVDAVPEIAPPPQRFDVRANAGAARPRIDFQASPSAARPAPAPVARYRSVLVSAVVFAAMVLIGAGAVMAIRNDATAMSGTATATVTVSQEPAIPGNKVLP
ncbi:hypothetical protein A5651_05730 [Mycobacterium sp. 1274761.0]|nr:hypothetical protein A5651_05730 [Mycobacterium sp. 1274761.0]